MGPAVTLLAARFPAAPAAVLMAQLREHVNAGRGCPARVDASRGCPDCVPEVGFYCRVVRPLASAFYHRRRAEVMAARRDPLKEAV